ncbi:hypothetical protein SB748_28950 [Rhizobium sp. SIMBA_035]
MEIPKTSVEIAVKKLIDSALEAASKEARENDVDLFDAGTLAERLKASNQWDMMPKSLRRGMTKTHVIFHVDRATRAVIGFHFDPPPAGRSSG